jgi:hypothetical protein
LDVTISQKALSDSRSMRLATLMQKERYHMTLAAAAAVAIAALKGAIRGRAVAAASLSESSNVCLGEVGR